MSQASAYEQYLLELINADRARAGAQPLAFDGSLNAAAEQHSRWMLDADVFSHTGLSGSSAGQRMISAGYRFAGSWSWGENIARAGTRAPAGLQDEVALLHANLMNSTGHRQNLLNGGYREIGIGFEVGDFQGRENAVVTEDFARTSSNPFLTGVAFADKDGDRAYDVGEGLANVAVTVTNIATGQAYSAMTGSAGGYEMELGAANYRVAFSAPGLASGTQSVTIGSRNVKADWIAPADAASGGAPAPAPTPAPAPAPMFVDGTTGNDRMIGTAADNAFRGLAGNDSLYGRGGNDVLDGGAGRDIVSGGSGHDTLTGGAGRDLFLFQASPSAANVDRITDFSSLDDTILLDDAVFRAIGPQGPLAASAFALGASARDATDRLLYDPNTGRLLYDPDGSGATAPMLIAELALGTSLNASDFHIV